MEWGRRGVGVRSMKRDKIRVGEESSSFFFYFSPLNTFCFPFLFDFVSVSVFRFPFQIVCSRLFFIAHFCFYFCCVVYLAFLISPYCYFFCLSISPLSLYLSIPAFLTLPLLNLLISFLFISSTLLSSYLSIL